MKHIELDIGGKTYKIASELDSIHAKKYLAWARVQIPSPLDTILKSLDRIPERMQQVMLKDALADSMKPLSFDSPEVVALMKTMESVIKLNVLFFQTFQPHLSDEQAEALIQQAEAQYGNEELYKRLFPPTLEQDDGNQSASPTPAEPVTDTPQANLDSKNP